MQCHYCEDDADVTVEKEGIKVGVCATHFREQLAELEEADVLAGVEEEIDVDRTD